MLRWKKAISSSTSVGLIFIISATCFSKHTKLITRDKVYNMLGKLPQMVFGNLKKNLSRMQRRRFDDLDVDKNRSLNTRGKRVILDQPNARASLASVALSLLSFQ